MFEQEMGLTLMAFFAGLVLGIIGTLLTYKFRSGSASPTKLKQEMEQYQDQVEAHFEETSKKFKQMTTQYQDLYQHLSVGATSLCRAENIAPGLIDDTSPLASKGKIKAQVVNNAQADKEKIKSTKPSNSKPNSSDDKSTDKVSPTNKTKADEKSGSTNKRSEGMKQKDK